MSHSRGIVVLADGSLWMCGHVHPTDQAAKRCGAKAARDSEYAARNRYPEDVARVIRKRLRRRTPDVP